MQENQLKSNDEILASLSNEEQQLSADQFYLKDVQKTISEGEFFVSREGQNEGEKLPTGRIDKFEQSVFYKKFEKEHVKDFNRCEVKRKSNEELVIQSDTERYVTKKANYKKRMGLEPATSVNKILKNYSLEEWVVLTCRLFDAMPSMINLMDIDIKRIAYTSPVLSAKGMSTIKQLEILMQSKERKEQYLNIYVLNQMFVGLLKNDEERKVFRYVLQGTTGSIKKRYGDRLRTAYRIRKNIINRCKEYCLSMGYDEDWFYCHFADLPPVHYVVEEEKTL